MRCLMYLPNEDGNPGLIACGIYSDQEVQDNRRRYAEELRALLERRGRVGPESSEDPSLRDPDEHPGRPAP
jgi:hypothetical protein